jgi:hypothetical protein
MFLAESHTKDEMKRPLQAIVIALLVLLALVYVGDYCSVRYQIPHGRSQFAQVTVTSMYAIHVKNGKIQYEPGDQEIDTCVNSLFPHFGDTPCWYLRRHTNKIINI